jgi:hypothetical protein
MNLLMKPVYDQDDDSQAEVAKRYYTDSGDPLGALGKMPFSRTRERLLLRGLHRHGKTTVCDRKFILITSCTRPVK